MDTVHTPKLLCRIWAWTLNMNTYDVWGAQRRTTHCTSTRISIKNPVSCGIKTKECLSFSSFSSFAFVVSGIRHTHSPIATTTTTQFALLIFFLICFCSSLNLTRIVRNYFGQYVCGVQWDRMGDEAWAMEIQKRMRKYDAPSFDMWESVWYTILRCVPRCAMQCDAVLCSAMCVRGMGKRAFE